MFPLKSLYISRHILMGEFRLSVEVCRTKKVLSFFIKTRELFRHKQYLYRTPTPLLTSSEMNAVLNEIK